VFTDEHNEEICVFYRQYDGYPDGHGLELKEAFGHFKLVNGIGEERTDIANGMGCLAAQVIAKFKDGPGGFYVYPPGTRDVWEDFVYVLSPDESHIKLEIGRASCRERV